MSYIHRLVSKFFIHSIRISIVILLIPFFLLKAQSENLSIENLTTKDGLSQNSVIKIFQDSKNFLWFGTFDGVNRYDGYSFSIYKSIVEDNTTIGGLNINSICEDSQGYLWFGSLGGGISKFNRKTKSFERLVHDDNNQNSLINNYVRDLLIDKKGNLWIATEYGLDRYNLNTKKFTHFLKNLTDVNTIGNDFILSLGQDEMGNVWVGTGYTIDRFDEKKNSFIHFLQPGLNGGTNKIYLDKSNTMWFGTNDGLCKYDRRLDKLILYPNNDFQNTNQSIREIFEDRLGNIWVAYFSGGTYLFDKTSSSFSKLKNNITDKINLSKDIVYTILEDKSGLLWFGTSGCGVGKLDFRKAQFKNYSNQLDNNTSLSNNKVYSLYYDDYDVVWIGTYGGGLNKYDNKSDKKRFTRILHDDKDPASLIDNRIYCISKDNNGILWIGTQTGLDYYDTKKSKFIRSSKLPQLVDPVGGPPPTVFTIFRSSINEVWIGTYGYGFFLYNPKNNSITNYRNNYTNQKSLSNNTVRQFFEDSKGNIWICTDNGLNKFDRNNNSFSRFINEPGNHKSISSNIVLNMIEDKNGFLWVGTTNGLNKIESLENKKLNFIRYSIKDGLPDNNIQGILEAENGIFWISTNKGLSKFDQQKKIFINYSEADGLTSDEFYVNSFCKTKQSDEFIFGGNNGFCVFKPNEIKDDNFRPQIVLTDFMIFNQSVPIKKEILGSIVLQKSIEETQEIELSYKHSVITFEYSALQFVAPGTNHYAYFMEGLETNWNYVGNRRYATYVNLPPGEYVFKVKASNISGLWNDTGINLRIKVNPPFWNTWLFKIISFVSILTIFLIGYKVRINSIEKREKILEQLNEKLNIENFERKKSEEAIKLYAEELNYLNITKDKLFSIIAHDLKNPFHAIINTSKLLSSEYDNLDKKEHLEFLNLMSKSSEAAYHLLENLLQWARSQRGDLSFEKNNIDLNAILQETIALLSNQAKSKRIQLKNFVDINTIIYVNNTSINTVIRNLITNAIKYSNENEIVSIDCLEIDDQLQINISDTGIGLSPEEINGLFEIEKNKSQVGTAGEKGSGLGLIICKDFVEKNGGKIWVKSELGKGSTFSFTVSSAQNKN